MQISVALYIHAAIDRPISNRSNPCCYLRVRIEFAKLDLHSPNSRPITQPHLVNNNDYITYHI